MEMPIMMLTIEALARLLKLLYACAAERNGIIDERHGST